MRMKKIMLVGGLAVVMSTLIFRAGAGQSVPSETINPQAIDAYLTAQVKDHRLPGLSVVVIDGGQVVFSQGYGNKDVNTPITADTQFHIGSITKSFTALAILQLVEQGKVDLDAPVQDYIPWFAVADPTVSTQITIRDLLNHTSGLSEKGDPHASEVSSSLEEQARLLNDVKPSAPVGTVFQYYNQNYRLLGYVIETVTGISYADYIEQNIFSPLGMTHSTAHPSQAVQLAPAYGRAFGFALPQMQTLNPAALPSGNLISSGSDMALFMQALIQNRRVDGAHLLEPDLLQEMRTLPEGVDTQYGMGCLVLDDGRTIALGGMLDFYQAFYYIDLSEQSGFVVLFNQNGVENMLVENNDIRDGMIKLVSGQEPAQPSFWWIGWVLILLAAADLANHVRLWLTVKKWAHVPTRRKVFQVTAGLGIPILVVAGLPLTVRLIQGGSPSWAEPMRMIPDLTIWLLVGMGLTFIRSVIGAILLWKGQHPGQ